MGDMDHADKLLGEVYECRTNKETLASPKQMQPCAATTAYSLDDSDDEFALPTACPSEVTKPSSREGSAETAVGAAESSEEPAEGAPRPSPPSVLESESEERGPPTASVDAPTKSDNAKGKESIDQTKLESFLAVVNQKNTFWDNVTVQQLVWYKNCPAIVVPKEMLFCHPFHPPVDSVMAYGPSSVDVKPAAKRYVALQFFPLCFDCHKPPATDYDCAKGKQVEAVLPYNAVLDRKTSAKARRLGPEDKWASTDHHYIKLRQKYYGKGVTKENWEISLRHAQKFLARALELRAQREESSRVGEKERRRHEREMEEAQEAAADADADAAADDVNGKSKEEEADSPPPPPPATEKRPQLVKLVEGLPLAPGDRIFFWDKLKVAGLDSARREATILEIRSRKAAKKENLCLLVLDNQQIVQDDCAIQRFIKDKDTGKVTLDTQACLVEKHKLKTGKLKGSDPTANKRMEALVAGVQENIRSAGVGDLLRKTWRRGDRHRSDGDETSGDDDDDPPAPPNTATKRKKTRHVKDSAASKRGRASNTGSGRSGGRDGGGNGKGRASVGGTSPPLDEDDRAEAVARSIAKQKRAKTTKGEVATAPSRAEEKGKKEAKTKAKTKAKEETKGKTKGGAKPVKERVADKIGRGQAEKTAPRGAAGPPSKIRSSPGGVGGAGGGRGAGKKAASSGRSQGSSSGKGNHRPGDDPPLDRLKLKKRKASPSTDAGAAVEALPVTNVSKREERQGPHNKKLKDESGHRKSRMSPGGRDVKTGTTSRTIRNAKSS